jgi:hypothetical protein
MTFDVGQKKKGAYDCFELQQCPNFEGAYGFVELQQ